MSSLAATTKSRGFYAEALIGGIVIVWASEPCPGLLWYVIQAYAAAAAMQNMDELEIFYRSRRIVNGTIEPMDLV